MCAPITTAAFEAARRSYTVFTVRAAAALARETGFSYVETLDAPDTFEKVQFAYRHSCKTHAAFPVSSEHCDNTVFLSREGNYAFRFFHDVVSHGAGKLTFSLSDEIESGMQWVRKVSAHFGAQSIEALIAYTDTVAQSLYADATGHFPDDQLAFCKENLRVGLGDRCAASHFVHKL